MTTKIKDMFNKNTGNIGMPLWGVSSFLLVLVFPLVLGAAEPSKAPSPAKPAQAAASPVQSAAAPSSNPSLPQTPSSADNIAQQSKEALKKIEKSKAAYFYDPRGKRDPFRSPYMEEKTTTQVVSEEEKITLEGLQQFKANALQLTGIIIKGKEHVAMVKAPDGRIYILREKSKVGPAGIVKKILKSKVIIEEEYTLKASDDFGNVTTRKEKKEIVMSLHNT